MCSFEICGKCHSKKEIVISTNNLSHLLSEFQRSESINAWTVILPTDCLRNPTVITYSSKPNLNHLQVVKMYITIGRLLASFRGGRDGFYLVSPPF